jgi:D-glycero-beta-D-manno-heptose-7-phosphate kinase
MSLREDFYGKRILVAGDVMLDRRKYFLSEGRMSQEAPVPILKETKDVDETPGGAANVATNLRELDMDVIIAGAVGDDESGNTLQTLLTKEFNIDPLLIKDPSRPTTQKTNELVYSKTHPLHLLCRKDHESTHPLSSELGDKIIEQIEGRIKNTSVDAVIISDYAKGLFTQTLVNSLYKVFEGHPHMIVDTKPQNIHFYKGFPWFKPNVKEAQEMTWINYTSPDDEATIERMGHSLFEKSRAKHVLFTLGRDGMIFYESPERFSHIPATEIENANVAGAGDTVCAVLGAALAGGYDPSMAVRMANVGAGLVVSKQGTATVTAEELETAWRGYENTQTRR